MTWFTQRSAVTQSLLLVALFVSAAGLIDAASAAPFGVTAGAAPQAVDGFAGWILAEQARFYRMLSSAIRAAKADGSAAFALMGISFAYGVFHAAGPGHGKAVISSYLVANNETWKRGIALSFISAVLQAITAIAIVGVMAVLLGATSKAMGDTVRVVEVISYGLIVLIGLRLVWVKGRAFLRLLMPAAAGPQLAHAGHEHGHHHHEHHPHDARDHGHEHGHPAHVHTEVCAHDHNTHHQHGAHSHHDHHHHGHAHDHNHDHDDGHAWGHAHAPEPSELTGQHWLRRGLAAVVAVGLRPCSGAIIVLVFALAQGIFWIGVASTFVMGLGTAITVSGIALIAVAARGVAGRIAASKSGGGMLLLRGLEAGAAVVIVVFGVLLLTGYIVSERMIGV